MTPSASTPTEYIDHLLSREGHGIENIFSIVGRMEVLMNFFETQPEYRGFLPFLKTYIFVTRAVAESYSSKIYPIRDFPALEKLDIFFAYKYFSPMRSYLLAGDKLPPWETYLSHCTEQNTSPFVQMLLGINAHINTDLCVTLIAEEYDKYDDFLAVNDILTTVIPEVMHYLAFSSHDIFGSTGLLFKQFFRKEFHLIIVRWRLSAWENAKFIKRNHITDYEKRLSDRTEQIALRIITIFKDITKLHHMGYVMDELHNLSARLT